MILLLMFMVAGIYFMKDLLLFVFTKILLNVRSKSCWPFCFPLWRQYCPHFWMH